MGPTQASTQRRLISLASILAIVALFIFLGLRHPDSVAFAPICPLNATTGLYCPGCGTGRAIHHVANGRLEAAWHLNPMLLIIGLPLLLVALGSEIRLMATGQVRPAAIWFSRMALIAAIVLVAWGIVRNLPIDSPIPLVPQDLSETATKA